MGFELPQITDMTCDGIAPYSIKVFTIDYVQSILDIDECDRFSPCDQNCNNTEGSFECSCNDGFQLQDSALTCEGKEAYPTCVNCFIILLIIIRY